MIIGIDPDLHKSGVAISESGRLLTLDNLSLLQLIGFVEEHKHQAVFKLEDVNAIKPTFPRTMKNSRTGRSMPVTPKVRDNISQKVGMVKGVGTQIEQILKESGAKYELVKPLDSAVKKKAKKEADYFNKITGWKGRTNEDQRDAGMIALYGRGRLYQGGEVIAG